MLGEVLWDLFEDSQCLGGAPLNFGVHAHRLGHPVTLISALGSDALGDRARRRIAELGLDTRHLQTTPRFPTGTATVQAHGDGGHHFHIPRPAAYDAVAMSASDLQAVQETAPAWFYFGTLFASRNRPVLDALFAALPQTKRFYDLNLRPDSDDPTLIEHLLGQADVVKLNEDELLRVSAFTGLPPGFEAFLREGSRRFGWQSAAVTLGERGCAILAGGRYCELAGPPVEVVDTVGAGDAFGAAFLHGLSSGWAAPEIAAFANRLAAQVVTHQGAIPDLVAEEALQP